MWFQNVSYPRLWYFNVSTGIKFENLKSDRVCVQESVSLIFPDEFHGRMWTLWNQLFMRHVWHILKRLNSCTITVITVYRRECERLQSFGTLPPPHIYKSIDFRSRCTSPNWVIAIVSVTHCLLLQRGLAQKGIIL